MSLERDLSGRREYFGREEDPGPLTGLALGAAAGRQRAPEPLRRAWRAALGEIAGSRTLELGCGHGGELRGMTDAGALAVGIDFAPHRLAMARRNAPAAGLLLADAERLPFGDAVFAAITANAVLLHLDRRRVMAEVGRVLASGGRAVFLEPLADHPLLRFYRNFLARRPGVVDYPHLAELERLTLGDGSAVTPWCLTAALPLFLGRAGGGGRFLDGLVRLALHLDALLFRRGRWCREHAWLALAVYRKP